MSEGAVVFEQECVAQLVGSHWPTQDSGIVIAAMRLKGKETH